MLSIPAEIPKEKDNGHLVAIYAAVIGFLTYASVYAFRKPFTVGIYAGQPAIFGLAFKDALVVSQLLGYATSKFYGIRFIAELKRIGRGKTMLLLVFISWMALLAFAVVPAPYNVVLLFVNGFPLGIIWGIIFSYAEGRRTTDLIGASLAVSFIFSSGFVKSVAKWVMLNFSVTEIWLPFVTGSLFVLPMLLFVYLLDKIPPPNDKDRTQRVERIALDQAGRKQLFKELRPALILLIVTYVFLTIFRDVRDSFAANMWSELGYGNQPSVFTKTEIPITLVILLIMGSMIIIRNNRRALQIINWIVIIGFLIAGGSSLLFWQNQISGFMWMTLTGLGLYLGYIPFNCILFERLIAVYRKPANVGFLMYLADSFGYLGSIGVLFFKTLLHLEMRWVDLYSRGVMFMSVAGIILTLITILFFSKKFQHSNE
jgi:MFS family permease